MSYSSLSFKHDWEGGEQIIDLEETWSLLIFREDLHQVNGRNHWGLHSYHLRGWLSTCYCNDNLTPYPWDRSLLQSTRKSKETAGLICWCVLLDFLRANILDPADKDGMSRRSHSDIDIEGSELWHDMECESRHSQLHDVLQEINHWIPIELVTATWAEGIEYSIWST
jgi:hypothetical protein